MFIQSHLYAIILPFLMRLKEVESHAIVETDEFLRAVKYHINESLFHQIEFKLKQLKLEIKQLLSQLHAFFPF